MESLVMKKCESVISELIKFSENILSLGNPILDSRLEQLEQSIKYELPIDFKLILKRFNGFSLCGKEVSGLGVEYKESSLDRIYNFEHSQSANKMPSHFFPFSNDGRGNHYCLDLSKLNASKTCPIIFWQCDYNYGSMNEVETCNEDFCEWIKEVMIEWTLDEYNYDGTDK